MTTAGEISLLIEEARSRAMRAASMTTYEQRHRQAQAIDMLLVQATKLKDAEINALMAEARDLDVLVKQYEAAAAEKGAA